MTVCLSSDMNVQATWADQDNMCHQQDLLQHLESQTTGIDTGFFLLSILFIVVHLHGTHTETAAVALYKLRRRGWAANHLLPVPTYFQQCKWRDGVCIINM